MNKFDPRRGVVLIAVLWMIAFLSALGMAASLNFRGFATVVATDRDKVVAEALLNAGLEASAKIVSDLGKDPLTDRETFISLPAGTIRIRLIDEGGRIDINKASKKLLLNLLLSIGADPEVAETIAQGIEGWRAIAVDSFEGSNGIASNNITGPSIMSQPAVPSNTASSGSLAPQNAQKDVGMRAFTDVHQLALIPGMTSEFLDAIVPLTTVFGYGKINGLTAPRGVIAALPDLNKEQITALLDAREGTLNEDWLAKHLGSTKDFVTINSRAVAAVELTVKLIDGYHSRVEVVFMIVPGDAEPYRVLAWNPVSFGTSKSHTADGS